MSKTYIVTGRDTGHPLLDLAGTLNGLNIGDTFTTTLSGSLEAKLLGAGLIAHTPVPHAVTSAGTPVVRSFPFAFDTPNLVPGGDIPGAVLYTPTIGDILLDAWVEIDTAWNGTTPKLGIGRYESDPVSPDGGWWGWWWTAIALVIPDETGQTMDNGFLSEPSDKGAPALTDLAQFQTYSASQNPGFQARGVPGKFVIGAALDSSSPHYPVRALVSTTGQPTGANPGSTQGAAILYLITATPV